MEKYMQYYLNDSRFNGLYYGGNERVRTYLELIFEKSYNLFVLHSEGQRDEFYDDIKKAKLNLTLDDIEYLIAVSGDRYSKEYKINCLLNGKGEGDGEYDTTDTLLLEWKIPDNITDVGKCKNLPAALKEWLEMARNDFNNTELWEGEYYLKNVYISFLFDEQWFSLCPCDIGLNEYVFERYADDLNLSLQSYGARFVRYHGMID